jgi:hypothetical protein
MSFYSEYLTRMGDERLQIEYTNIGECIKIAERSRYQPDVERLYFKRSDICQEMGKRAAFWHMHPIQGPILPIESYDDSDLDDLPF